MSLNRVGKLACAGSLALSAGLLLSACQNDTTSTPTSSASPSTSASAPSSAPSTKSAQHGPPRDTHPVAPAPGSGPGKAPYTGLIQPKQIPLDGNYKWAYGAMDPKANEVESYKYARLCGSTDPGLDEGGITRGKQVGLNFKAAKGGSGQGQWQAAEYIEHLSGETSGVVQGTNTLFQALASELKYCGQYKPGATVQVTASDATYVAATLKIPGDGGGGGEYILHDYLVLQRTSVAELAVWTQVAKNGNPAVAWPNPDPKKVVADIGGALCAGYKDC